MNILAILFVALIVVIIIGGGYYLFIYKPKHITQPIVQSTVQPITQSISQPIVQSNTQPIIQSTVQSSVQPVIQSISQPIVQVISQPTAQVSSQSTVQPVVQSTSQPIIQQTQTATTQPIVQSTIQPIVQPIVQPLQKIPIWLQSGKIDGYYEFNGQQMLFTAVLQSVPSATDIQITGSGIMVSAQQKGTILIKGNIKDGKVLLQLQNEIGKVESATGNLTDAQQTLTSITGKYTVWTRGSNNALKLPEEMDAFYVYQCTKYPFQISNIIVNGSSFAGFGKDQVGEFYYTGTVSSSSVDLVKNYRIAGQSQVQYKGKLQSNVITGQWSIGTVGNEFVMYPKGVSYTQTIDYYGSGANCIYKTEWTGSITYSTGESEAVTISEFIVDPNGLISARGSDKWGNSTFTGTLDGKNVQMQKQYDGRTDIIYYKGTLTYSVLQGNWNNDYYNGTFLFRSK